MKRTTVVFLSLVLPSQGEDAFYHDPVRPIYRSAEGNRSMDQLFLGGHTAKQAIHPHLQFDLVRVGTRTYAYGRSTGRPRIQDQTPYPT